jgi:hypothetical protein
MPDVSVQSTRQPRKRERRRLIVVALEHEHEQPVRNGNAQSAD